MMTPTTTTAHDAGDALIAIENERLAHNYHPLPVVVERGEGAWVTDVNGNRYLDCLAAYSAVNFGHGHPDLLAAARDQLERITLTSRAFHNDRLGPFAEALARLAGVDRVLPMNTGAEAVESAIKLARAWGYRVKGVPDGAAEIIVMSGNFHGRTTTIVSFSDDPQARDGFAPFTPGFVTVPYGDAAALEAAITDHTVAVLLEPIQGEAGVVVPPADYLPAVRRITAEHTVLMIADEIQSGLGRTGATFQCDNAGVIPARRRAVGRHRHRPVARDRAPGVRGAARARCSREGHARFDDQARAAHRRVEGGPRLGSRPARGGARRVRVRGARAAHPSPCAGAPRSSHALAPRARGAQICRKPGFARAPSALSRQIWHETGSWA